MAQFVTIIFPFVYIKNSVQEFECQRAYLCIRGKILQLQRMRGNVFAFASHLSLEKERLKGQDHGKATWPGISITGSALHPKPPLCSEHRASFAGKAKHLVFQSGTTLEINCLAPESTPSLFVLPGQPVMSSLCGWICILLL